MDVFLSSVGFIFIIIGLIGCFLPILPGPPLSFIGLIFLDLTEKSPFSAEMLWTWAAITIVVTALDYIVPVVGTKRYGGSKRGVWGSTIGLIIGLFMFPPFGIIIGPFVGAFIGELSSGKTTNERALRAALGSFIGFLVGTIFKLIASGWMTWLFFVNLFS